MDLPERLIPRIKSRIGDTNRLIFHAYTREQIETIIIDRLKDLEVFSSESIRMCASKVTNLSGDIRTALSMCRRAVEIREENNNNNTSFRKSKSKSKQNNILQKVTIEDINLSSKELSESILNKIMCSSSLYEKIFLYSLIQHIKINGVELVNSFQLYNRMKSDVLLHDNGSVIEKNEFDYICKKLNNMNIIEITRKASDVYFCIFIYFVLALCNNSTITSCF